MVATMDSFLLPLFLCLFCIAFYPALMIYVAIIADAGFFTWFILAVMLSPFVALGYFIVKKRLDNYLKILLDNKPKEWNITKTLEEYRELLKKSSSGKG